MDQFEKEIEDKISNLSDEFIVLLRKNNLLNQFLKNFITNFICSKVSLDINVEEINDNFCKKNNLLDEKALLTFLSFRGINMEDHKRNLENSEKIKLIADKEFSKNAETEFINSKTALDKYTYSLLTVEESDLAYELYHQIESKEAQFSELASKYSAESNNKNMGIIGPQSIANVHPALKEKILIAKKGEILNPFQIDKWWVILRVEDKIEAKLDDTQRSKITLSLFDKWVSILTINSLKKLIDNTTAEAI